MEKKKVADVIKEILPVAVDIISDKLSKEDTNGVKMECIFEKADDKPGMKTGTVKSVTLHPGDSVFTNDNGECEVIRKEDKLSCSDKDFIDTVNDVHELAVGLIKYKPINKIVDTMNENGFSDKEKIEESYCNGFVDGFMLANCVQQHHIDYVHEQLSNINETIETAKCLIEQKF